MTQSTLKALVLGLSFLGIADAWYLAKSAIMDTPLVCGIEHLDGCNVVAQSVYSHLFGIPLGVYGVVFYALVFILAALALWRAHAFITRSLFYLGVVGLVASIIFEGIQIFLIQAICIYCLGSAIIAVFIFVATFLLHKRESTPPSIPAGVVLS